MANWLAWCFDDGWRRILNGNPTYRYVKLEMTADEDGYISIADVNVELTPAKMYRALDPVTVRNYRLCGPNDVILNPHVSGDVINFGGNAANQVVTFWVNTIPLNPQASVATPLWGDVNDDGLINSDDVTQISRYAVGLSVDSVVAVEQRGDITGNGTVTITDAQQLQRWLNGQSVSQTVTDRVGFACPGATVDPGADARPIIWPDGHELVLSNYLAAFMLTKGAVESRASGDLFAVCDTMFTNMIQATMDRSTQHQQITPNDSSESWSAGPNW